MAFRSVRIWLAYIGITVILVMNAWVLSSNFQQVSKQEILVKQVSDNINLAELTLSAMKDAETGARGYVIAQRESYLEPYHTAVLQAPRHAAELERSIGDDASARDLLALHKELINDRFGVLARLVKLNPQTQKDEVLKHLVEGKMLMDQLRKHTDDLKYNQRQKLLRYSEDAAKSRSTFFWSLVGTTLFSWFLLSFTVFQISRNLKRALLESQEKELQSWQRNHLTELSKLSSGDINLKQAASNILSYLSLHTPLMAARLYNFDGKQLREVDSFGAPMDAHAPQGGLIREAMKKDSLWVVKDIPQDFWSISSGLGKAQPRFLVYLPLIFQSQTVGILEMAAFETLSDEYIDLFNGMSEILGTNLNAAISREELQTLLAKAQTMTEELQAQQEELRTANEELEHQAQTLEVHQESLHQRNAELEITRKELEHKAVDLEKSSKYKSEFLAKMSHELRTPLNGLLLLSTLLVEDKEKNLSQQQQQFAQSIHNAGNDLLLLINDILDLSKIEARKLTLRAEHFKLHVLLEQLHKMFHPQANVKGLAIKLEVDPSLSDYVLHTDKQRLEQILRNFLSNAIKFTEKGQITIKAQPSDRQGFFKILIQDTGIGIPTKKKELIFNAFEQADGSISRQYGGTGLGLTISKELAHLLGGDIFLESAEGIGSTFGLELPANLEASEKPERRKESSHMTEAEATLTITPSIQKANQQLVDAIPHGARTILVVEDDQKFRATVMETARSHGFHPLEAADGETALDILNQHVPNAILLDIKLPALSGLSLLEMVKKNPQWRHIPIHMISAMDYQHSALRLGAQGYLTKPVTLEKIRSALTRIEEMITQQVRRVLVIEDDERQGEAIMQLIAGTDVQVSRSKTGKSAIEELKKRSFDCIILDLTLPDISGFDLLVELSSLPISLPPIVIYTAKELSPQEEDYLAKFSESIIIKGARSPERLLDEVNLFLHRVESMLPADKRQMLTELRTRQMNFEGKTVLLVDDDMRNVFALTSALEGKGFQVKIAKNGQEALKALEANRDIDITLMDIMMPVMDGFEAIRQIRASQDEYIRKMPVVALTAKVMRDDFEKCMQVGANDYLPKPVNLDNLLTVLKVWLPKDKLFT